MGKLWTAVGALILLSWLTSACGGGANDNDDVDTQEEGAELSDALASVDEDDLAIMVLPPDELGEFGDFQVDPTQSGYWDNAREAALFPGEGCGSADPADLQEAGRVTSYFLSFVNPTPGTGAGERVPLAVQTDVALFMTADQASTYLRYGPQLDRPFDPTCLGGDPGEMEPFLVAEIGDEAGGVGADTPSVAESYVQVAFRLGPIVGRVFIRGLDDAGTREVAIELARRLEARISAVARGELDEDPVSITIEEPSLDLDLQSMALRLEDLPQGARVDFEGYVDQGIGATATFSRLFDLMAARWPEGSPLSFLRVDIDLLDDSDDASLFLAALVATTPELAPGSQMLGLPDYGDESAALGLSYLPASASLDEVWIFVRVDRIVATLVASSLTDEVDPEDLETLAGLLVQRMRSELERSE